VDGVATALVGDYGKGLMTRYGRHFYKLSGSGNDFVFVDARTEPAGVLEQPETVGRICARATGVGADGIVFVEPPKTPDERFSIRYLNRDGSLALLCGNASLCSVRLAAELGIVAEGEDFRFGTGAGLAHGRLSSDGPEIDLQPVVELAPDNGFATAAGERRIGFAMVGVPHVVILTEEVAQVDVEGRGRPIRYDTRLVAGANVNFVSRRSDGAWNMRTYERGVEAETLACGTGSVATAALLRSWGESGDSTTIWTRSGLPLRIRFRESAAGVVTPSLNGEGRIVFRGELAV
jgi:diaminopimelate epimerase